MLKPVSTLKILPKLPPALLPLSGIAYNLRWSWDHAAIELFRRLDSDLWETCGHNPVLFLGSIEQSQLESAANDEAFLAHLAGVSAQLQSYMTGENAWFRREHAEAKDMLVAYFSAEFGITECLSIFAGGLGVLAGDHLKAASDLGVPLVGVGLLYQQGYFRQYLNAAGWQQEVFEDNDFHTLPIHPLPNAVVRLELPEGPLSAQVWTANVGRLTLYLLDTNLPSNKPEYRRITNQLYGGDLDMRIKQEILLGIGGYRALELLGLKPTAYHMNEGHSAFLGLEHVARLMEVEKLSFPEALVLASSSLVFTTHTPVPAGHDYFPSSLMERYFSTHMRSLGISAAEFLGLGRKHPSNASEDFCMTVLALRLAAFSNGVSKLHGAVSRSMWNDIWPGVPEAEVPIGHVTNGVHFRSWVSFEMNQLYDRYLGPKWRSEPADTKLWQRVESIPAPELWRTHERRRERLVAYARRLLRAQLIRRGAPQSAIDEADEVLSPDVLTIGFGRRFASYKRATLLLRDPERLARLLNHPERPVQIVFAGKAHPSDNDGKQLIKTLVELARRPEFRRRIVFLENYDLAIARYMVQGCDVWLNTPLRPLEASGTSGMKAQANGVVNVSTLDGWWDEAWSMGKASQCNVGWAIGRGETYEDPAYQDQVEAQALYELLESEIVPTFYERRADGVPPKWVARMKTSIARLCPEFNMHRAVMEYADRYYTRVHCNYTSLRQENALKLKELSGRLCRLRSAWPHASIEAIPDGACEIGLGDQIHLCARVSLGALTPDDVSAEALIGRLDANGEITEPTVVPMHAGKQVDAGSHLFEATFQAPAKSGLHGYAMRLVPRDGDYMNPFSTGLIKWADRPTSNGH
ncbi:MAG TPA: alpha-glucan family phosphorylase [Candidatus Acidoferrales bacterium]|nr:alpha-glucan family phosphorylase [Candidatus Acidoferrales bacterium]